MRHTFGAAVAGLNCVCCCTGQYSAGTLSLRVQQLEVTCETKSKDNVFVHLVVSIQYQVIREAIYDAFYKLTDSRSQITAYVFDVVRASVPKMDLDEIYVVRPVPPPAAHKRRASCDSARCVSARKSESSGPSR